MRFASLTLAVIFLSIDVLTENAIQIATSFMKGISFEIPHGASPFNSRVERYSSWYVDYELRAREELINPSGNDRYDAFITMMTVMNDGVYYRALNETWRKLESPDYIGLGLDTAMTFGMENQVTAALGAGNDSIVMIANQDLKVRVLDFRLKEADGSIKIINEVDALYGEDEGDYEIRSMWKIPYTSKVVFSSNRYELIKFDYLTGEKQVFENKLGPIRFVAGPVETDDPGKEPYNPNNDRSQVPQHIRDKLELPYFIMTGHERPMNMILDWTTLEPVFFFNLEKFSSFINTDADVDFRVGAITFIGNNPERNSYCMVVGNSKSLFIYSALHNRLEYGDTCDSCDTVKSLIWINGTKFISVQRESNLGLFINIDKLAWIGDNGSKNFLKREYGVTFDLERGGEEEDEFWYDYEKFDRLWLALKNVENSLSISTPVYTHDECESGGTFSRIHGRYRSCNTCVQTLAKITTTAQNNLNTTYINCQRPACPQGQVFHSYVAMNSPKNAYALFNGQYGSGGCLNRYQPTPSEIGYVYDNGCYPGYNINKYGGCQKCSEAFCSDCLDFFSESCMTLSIFDFTQAKMDTVVISKGGAGQDMFGNLGSNYNTYRGAFFFNGKKTSIALTTDENFWHKQDKRSLHCYLRDYYEGDDYILNVRKGYYLAKKEQVDFDISKQLESDPTDPMNFFVCEKNCEIGYYYDYGSLDCRRCSFGCSECKSYGKCDVCQAGLNMIKADEDYFEGKSLGVWGERLENVCIQGCIKGWFVRLFEGNCWKCKEDCQDCTDRFIRDEVNPTFRRDKGFCLECKEAEGQERYADFESGLCIGQCEGHGKVVREALRANNTIYKICITCNNPHCYSCDPIDKSKCQECQGGYEINPEDSSCIEQTNSKRRLYIILSIIIGVVLLAALVIYFSFCKKKKIPENFRHRPMVANEVSDPYFNQIRLKLTRRMV